VPPAELAAVRPGRYEVSPLTQRLPHYSVVRVLRTSRTADLRIDNFKGVIAGISDSGSRIEYAVLIGDTTWMIDSSDVVPAGEVLTREALYDGSSVRAEPQRYQGSE
jgi:hypothetical protein